MSSQRVQEGIEIRKTPNGRVAALEIGEGLVQPDGGRLQGCHDRSAINVRFGARVGARQHVLQELKDGLRRSGARTQGHGLFFKKTRTAKKLC